MMSSSAVFSRESIGTYENLALSCPFAAYHAERTNSYMIDLWLLNRVCEWHGSCMTTFSQFTDNAKPCFGGAYSASRTCR